MTFPAARHSVVAASGLGLLLLAAPSYAQTVAVSASEPSMTSQQQHTMPTAVPRS